MRITLINSVYEKLHVSPFRIGDFEVVERNNAHGGTFTITYRHDGRFKIAATISESGGSVSGSVSPGDMAANEKFSVQGNYAFLALITEWVQRVAHELAAIPTSRAIDEQRRQIDELLKQWGKLPDEYFTREEADQLRARLESLEEDFRVRLASLDMDEKKLDAKLKEVQRDFEFLKAGLDTQKKTGWARSFATRCVGWIRDPDNRALLTKGWR